jgi:hypothetical protein
MRIEVKLIRDDGTVISQQVSPISSITTHKIEQKFDIGAPIVEERGEGALTGWTMELHWIDLDRR